MHFLKSNNNCSTKFKYIRCIYCKRSIYIKKDVQEYYLDHINITCPYNTCKKIFVLSQCPECHIYQKIVPILTLLKV